MGSLFIRMIKLIKLKDIKEVKPALLRDSLYKSFMLDEVSLDYLDTIIHEWYIGFENHIPVGLFMINYFSSNCVEFHGGMYKEHRGKETPKRLRQAINILKEEKKCKFITKHPASNSLATKVVEKAGFKLSLTIPDACKDGDLLIFTEV